MSDNDRSGFFVSVGITQRHALGLYAGVNMAIDVVTFDGFGEVDPPFHQDYIKWTLPDRDGRMKKWDDEVATKHAEFKAKEAAAS